MTGFALLALGWCAVSLAGLGAATASGNGPVLTRAGAFSVVTTAQLGAAAAPGGAPAPRPADYQLRARVDLTPLYCRPDDPDGDVLTTIQLSSLAAWGRGMRPRADWKPRAAPAGGLPAAGWAAAERPYYARWRGGRLQSLYLDGAVPPPLQDYQRAVAGLFQFSAAAGERNETDATGACLVAYEPDGDNEIRKLKSSCAWESSLGGAAGAGAAGAVAVRRAARYRLAADGALAALRDEEIIEMGEPRLKARSLHELTALPRGAAAAGAPAASLSAALAALPARVSESPPAIPITDDDALPEDEVDEEDGTSVDWESLALAAADALGAGAGEAGGGTAAAARAVRRALPAARRQPRAALANLLHKEHSAQRLNGLVRLLGLAGTRAAHLAAAALLRVPPHADAAPDADAGERADADAAPPPLVDAYFAALALAPRPDEWTVREALRAAARPDGAGALLAAAAAAATRARAAAPAADELSRAVRDAVAGALGRCRDDPCRAARLLALANLGRDDAAEEFLRQAESGGRAPALAALDGLAALAGALSAARLRRLRDVALGLRRPRPLDVRAAALQQVLAAVAGPAPAGAALLAAALHDQRAPAELRRVFWQRAAALAAERPELAAALRRLPLRYRSWDALALAGTSSVLSLPAGWLAARVDSAQVALGGALRRGVVALRWAGRDALSLRLTAAGLAALAGGAEAGAGVEAEPGAAEEATEAELQLSAAGVHLRPLRLFSGQGELAAHVWAGTGSEPTAVLRAAAPLPGREGALAAPLAAGARLAARWAAAAAAALDAHATVSLWSRTARAGVALRPAAEAAAWAAVRGAAGPLAARAAQESEARLDIAVDADFYDGVALCVRVAVAEHAAAAGARWRGGGAGRARGARAERRPVEGRSLSLGRANDRACTTLAA